jgi:ethanolamine utilization protein EutN
VKFARVIGTVVSTRKYEDLEGIKFLVVQPLDEDLNPKGQATVAADATQQAGPGELVFMVASREGAQALPEVFVPVDLAITGIVDEVDVERGARREQPTASWHFPPKPRAPKKPEIEKPEAEEPEADEPAAKKPAAKKPAAKKPAAKKSAAKKATPKKPAAKNSKPEEPSTEDKD